MCMLKQINKENDLVVRLFRSPTLETVKMVERTIKEFNGELKKTSLWEKLPRKVQWGTYLTILDYLREINKIVIAENGIIVYIWDPKGAKEYLAKKHLDYDYTKTKRQAKNKS